MFRGLECTRPGTCVVWRGSDRHGKWRERTFDTASIERAQYRRTVGKSPRDQLLLIDHDDSSEVLFEGPAVAQWRGAIERYFAERDETTLLARVDPDPMDIVPLSAMVLVSLLTALVFTWHAFQARARFRIQILYAQGVVRLERMFFSRSMSVRDVPIEEIASVTIERGSWNARYGHNERVLLVTKDGLDVPLCARFLRSSSAHATAAAELRDALGRPSPTV
ncbi:hypothetical protein [Labilithrix luteola]|nr:hypothetical protein [Labilithrix luteola]